MPQSPPEGAGTPFFEDLLPKDCCRDCFLPQPDFQDVEQDNRNRQEEKEPSERMNERHETVGAMPTRGYSKAVNNHPSRPVILRKESCRVKGPTKGFIAGDA